jgi:hypothetical protein
MDDSHTKVQVKDATPMTARKNECEDKGRDAKAADSGQSGALPESCRTSGARAHVWGCRKNGVKGPLFTQAEGSESM